MSNYSLFTDAGSRGNPGNAAYGIFLFEDQKLLDFKGKYLGIKTNNQAEFIALKDGLGLAIKNEITNINCFADSELLIKQINGEYKIKNMELKNIIEDIKSLSSMFETITFTHIPREKNKLADKMVNIILDTVQHDKS
ncbi:ribonuclease HI family protein [Patescibacteria group bacterium]|nr:ribonuclease HI family protein [Patescibacteria group bacterium]